MPLLQWRWLAHRVYAIFPACPRKMAPDRRARGDGRSALSCVRAHSTRKCLTPRERCGRPPRTTTASWAAYTPVTKRYGNATRRRRQPRG